MKHAVALLGSASALIAGLAVANTTSAQAAPTPASHASQATTVLPTGQYVMDVNSGAVYRKVSGGNVKVATMRITPAAVAPAAAIHELPQSQCTQSPSGTATSRTGPNFVLDPTTPYLYHCYTGTGGLTVNQGGMRGLTTGNYTGGATFRNSSGGIGNTPVQGPHSSVSFTGTVTVTYINAR